MVSFSFLTVNVSYNASHLMHSKSFPAPWRLQAVCTDLCLIEKALQVNKQAGE